MLLSEAKQILKEHGFLCEFLGIGEEHMEEKHRALNNLCKNLNNTYINIPSEDLGSVFNLYDLYGALQKLNKNFDAKNLKAFREQALRFTYECSQKQSHDVFERYKDVMNKLNKVGIVLKEKPYSQEEEKNMLLVTVKLDAKEFLTNKTYKEKLADKK